MNTPTFRKAVAWAKKFSPDAQARILVQWQLVLRRAQEQEDRRAQRSSKKGRKE
jgi:hypothetical protein